MRHELERYRIVEQEQLPVPLIPEHSVQRVVGMLRAQRMATLAALEPAVVASQDTQAIHEHGRHTGRLEVQTQAILMLESLLPCAGDLPDEG